MSRIGYRDPIKERRWRKLLGQWQRSDFTVRDFCKDHGLNEHAFYWWRRVITERDREQASADTPGDEAHFVPLHVAPGALILWSRTGQSGYWRTETRGRQVWRCRE